MVTFDDLDMIVHILVIMFQLDQNMNNLEK